MPTTENKTQEAMNTQTGHSGVSMTEKTWCTNTKTAMTTETHFMITHIITSHNYVGIKMQRL